MPEETAALADRKSIRGQPLCGLHRADAHKMAAGKHESLLFHYDILRPSRTGMRSHDRDVSLDLLKVAEKVTIFTISTSPKLLLKQLKDGEINRAGRKPRERDLKLFDLYQSPHFLKDWSSAWDKFAASIPGAKRIAVENDGDFNRVS